MGKVFAQYGEHYESDFITKCSKDKKWICEKSEIGVDSLPKTSLMANFVHTSALGFAKKEKLGEIRFS
jgi:hypothetical protein